MLDKDVKKVKKISGGEDFVATSICMTKWVHIDRVSHW